MAGSAAVYGGAATSSLLPAFSAYERARASRSTNPPSEPMPVDARPDGDAPERRTRINPWREVGDRDLVRDVEERIRAQVQYEAAAEVIRVDESLTGILLDTFG